MNTAPTLSPAVPAVDLRHRVRHLAGPAALAAGAATSLAFVGLVAPEESTIYPACPSWTVFGVLCPFCGGLRAAHALATGDIPAMLANNLLLPVVVLVAAWTWLSWTSARLGRRVLPRLLVTAPRARTIAGIVLAYGVLRNLPVEPFTALAP